MHDHSFYYSCKYKANILSHSAAVYPLYILDTISFLTIFHRFLRRRQLISARPAEKYRVCMVHQSELTILSDCSDHCMRCIQLGFTGYSGYKYTQSCGVANYSAEERVIIK